MTLQKCHKCDKLIEDNFYCDSCAMDLKLDVLKKHTHAQEQKPKPKNPAKMIHKAMFGP
jgi:hypothetical protein